MQLSQEEQWYYKACVLNHDGSKYITLLLNVLSGCL